MRLSGDPPRAASRGGRKALPEFIKAELVPHMEFIGHDPEAYLELIRIMVKPVRSLRDYADAWIEDQDWGPRHRPGLNRELLNQELTKIEKPAGTQSKGLPQRGCQVLAAVAPSTARSVPDRLRKIARSSRSGYSPVEDLPVISFGSKGRRYREEARRVCRAHGRTRLYRTSGSPARRMVHASEASRLRPMQGWLCTSSIGA